MRVNSLCPPPTSPKRAPAAGAPHAGAGAPAGNEGAPGTRPALGSDVASAGRGAMGDRGGTDPARKGAAPRLLREADPATPDAPNDGAGRIVGCPNDGTGGTAKSARGIGSIGRGISGAVAGAGGIAPNADGAPAPAPAAADMR